MVKLLVNFGWFRSSLLLLLVFVLFSTVLLPIDRNVVGCIAVAVEGTSLRGDTTTNAETRIIGGTDVTIPSNEDSASSDNNNNNNNDFRYPYFVLLHGSNICGGVLIAPLLVVTAAHCETSSDIARIAASKFPDHPSSNPDDEEENNEDENDENNENDEDDGTTTVEIVNIVIKVTHPNYDPSQFTHDIMIMKLNRPSTKQYLKLNPNPSFPTTTTIQEDQEVLLTLLGFGRTTDPDNDDEEDNNENEEDDDDNDGQQQQQQQQQRGQFPEILQEILQQYVDLPTCRRMHSVGGSIKDEMVCAIDENLEPNGPCHGDSGGPLIFRKDKDNDDDDGSNNDDDPDPDPSEDILIGIVSWGRGCANTRYPTVYSSIAYFYPWLVQTSCELTTRDDVLPNDFICFGVKRFDDTDGPTTSQRPSQSLIPSDRRPSEIPSEIPSSIQPTTLSHSPSNHPTESSEPTESPYPTMTITPNPTFKPSEFPSSVQPTTETTVEPTEGEEEEEDGYDGDEEDDGGGDDVDGDGDRIIDYNGGNEMEDNDLEFVSWSSTKALGRCQGHCTSDVQCINFQVVDDNGQVDIIEPMICYKLNTIDVPGCNGYDVQRSINYCVYLKDLEN